MSGLERAELVDPRETREKGLASLEASIREFDKRFTDAIDRLYGATEHVCMPNNPSCPEDSAKRVVGDDPINKFAELHYVLNRLHQRIDEMHAIMNRFDF